MIIAVSDVHLGYYCADAVQFKNFLKNVVDKSDVDHFVLLGDIIDLWRREPAKMLLEYRGILKGFKNFKPEVHYIIGNHDYHMIELKQHLLNHLGLDVSADITLKDGGATYYFIHGYQYEWRDRLALLNKFANTLSLADDDIGRDADRLWSFYHDLMPSILGWIKSFIFPVIGKEVLKQPGERLNQDKLNEIEKEALAELKKRSDNAFLIYGHTHRPKVDNQNRCANTGSWVDDPNLPSVQKNTYLKISGTNVTLKEW